MDSNTANRKLDYIHKYSYRPGSELTRPLQAIRSEKAALLEALQQADDVQQFVKVQKFSPYLRVLEGCIQKDLSPNNVTETTHAIRSVNAGLSCRVSALWNIRENNANAKISITDLKYLMLGMLRCEIDLVLGLYKGYLVTVNKTAKSVACTQTGGLLISSINNKCFPHQLAQLLHLLKGSIGRIIPSFLLRLNNFVVQTVRDTTMESMRQYCTQHPRDFLVLQRTHSVVLHSLLKVCGMQSARTKRSVHSEQVIFSLLRQHSMEPLYKSITLVITNVQIIQHYTSLAVSSALRFFLEYLLVHNERFDEPGVYQLFRTILKLQEYVGEVKKETSLCGTERFIEDVSMWKKAECIVQTLNSAVFALKPNRHPRVTNTNDSSNNISSIASNDTQYLSEEEKLSWRKLVGASNSKLGGVTLGALFRRQRHNGTVFITLELDFKNL